MRSPAWSRQRGATRTSNRGRMPTAGEPPLGEGSLRDLVGDPKPAQRQRIAQVLLGSQIVLEARQVSPVEQLGAKRRALRAGVLSVPEDVAGVGPHESRDAAQERRLAAAVRAAQCDPLPGRDREGNIAKERRGSPRPGELVRLEASHGCTLSTTTFTSRAPGFTTALAPTRSPGCGVALPEREMRASTRTAWACEMRAVGAIAIVSSSAKTIGNCLAVARSTASGILGPPSARANTQRVSVPSTFAAIAGAMETEPDTETAVAAGAVAAILGACFEGCGSAWPAAAVLSLISSRIART